MSILGNGGRSDGGTGPDRRAVKAFVQERRSADSVRLCGGTLACGRCDAPIAIGRAERSLTDDLTCPFCGHVAPAREFLSLAAPSRPARVDVWVSRPAVR